MGMLMGGVRGWGATWWMSLKKTILGLGGMTPLGSSGCSGPAERVVMVLQVRAMT